MAVTTVLPVVFVGHASVLCGRKMGTWQKLLTGEIVCVFRSLWRSAVRTAFCLFENSRRQATCETCIELLSKECHITDCKNGVSCVATRYVVLVLVYVLGLRTLPVVD